jgi:ribonuclease HIII
MNAVYVIIENGDPYNAVYQTFESAVAVVKARHKETIDEQLKEADGQYDICSDLDTPEDKVTGKTYLYVEKGINIYIYKLPIAF